ncbi:adenylylsulfate kinase [Hydrogenispora ethanolica]|uniref:Adenylyl-sulfate kinase n=1 Tax=Hydrogenispora ethanolica TaxID=1082276 RepID=A0A4R1RGX7_HYDET|nr:adenylyl-sulfate kinase [Hydrogenispora ethanolica]TCL65271.1 adenylylsulfate kinase [Hydrogenispora ethanolica]
MAVGNPCPNNLTWAEGKVSYDERCKNLNQHGLVLWLTGLSGAGKTTIAVEVEKELIKRGKSVYRLDGDNIRLGLNSDLGFSEAERNENIRRIVEVAALFKDAGIITLVCFIAPFRKMREYARKKIGSDNFVEIYVKTDLKTCIARDPKGLYRKALNHEIREFTGITSPYEEPDHPDLVIDTERFSVSEAAQKILQKMSPFLKYVYIAVGFCTFENYCGILT